MRFRLSCFDARSKSACRSRASHQRWIQDQLGIGFEPAARRAAGGRRRMAAGGLALAAALALGSVAAAPFVLDRSH